MVGATTEMWAKFCRSREDEGPVLSEELGEEVIFELDLGRIINENFPKCSPWIFCMRIPWRLTKRQIPISAPKNRVSGGGVWEHTFNMCSRAILMSFQA